MASLFRSVASIVRTRAPSMWAAPIARSGVSAAFHTSARSALFIGDTVPNFQADSSEGKIDLHEFIGDSWAVFCSHPKDYTPVCTTELGVLQKLKPQFDERNVKIIALSVDPVDSHRGWINDIVETQGVDAISYPIIADPTREISKTMGMLDQTNILADGLPATVRSVFVVDPNKTLRLTITYPASTGRNFDEILRVVDSLQLTHYHKVATPVNWKKGEDCVIVPSVSNEDAKKLFPKGWKEVKPYLRLTPQPDL